jgi:hypothetical protein
LKYKEEANESCDVNIKRSVSDYRINGRY